MVTFTKDIVTDEHAAKAFLKGQIREAKALSETAMFNREQGRYASVRKNVKLAKKFFDEELSSYGEFLISSVEFKNYGVGSSKHWKSEYTAIEPELIHADNIGSLCRFVVGYFDSRKFCKGKLGFNIKLTSQFYFHEHFLFRCIYRLNEKSIGEIGGFVYPIMEWLIVENVPLTRINEINYFVYRDFTLVAEKLSHGYGMAFKTILETEFYTLEDKRKFAEAHQLLSESDPESIKVVMTNPAGLIVRKIPISTGKSLTNTVTEKSFWLRHMTESPDVRYGE